MSKKQKGILNSRNILNFLVAASLFTVAALAWNLAPAAFADGATAAQEAINGIVSVLRLITGVIGAIFVLLGLVRLAIAHANEDGPAQQKAAVMLATGVVLLLFGTLILGTLNPSSWLPSDVTGG